ncbi:MAG: D-alanyl-D-alanine carboxypeptidase family protein [Pseudonocardiaceae bacterium]
MVRSRAIAILIATLGGLALLDAAPGNAETPSIPTPPAPAPSTPDTSGCPNRVSAPPVVDLSEVPVPGAPVPSPLPLPERPVGGERLGECGLVVPDGAPAPPAGISAASWILADAGTGEVLAAKDPHARHRPASTIKLLTALLVTNRLSPDRVVLATKADANQEGSKAGIGPGGSYTVRQLLAGLLLVSGNDAAHALAGQLGGVPAAVAQLNELAAELGAHDTYAATPSGLDGPGMSTSAYDLALVFGHVLARPLLAELVSTAQVDFPGFGDRPGFVISNDNRLLGNYDGALGGKTGFTDDARHTYVGAAVRNGRVLIVVLLRGEQRPLPLWGQAAQLLDYGFTLPRGQAVGQLVTGPQPTETQPTVTPTSRSTAATPSWPGGNDGTASLGGSPETNGYPETNSAGGIVTGLVWLALAICALALLGSAIMYQRSRGGNE